MCKFVHCTTMWKIKALPRGSLRCKSNEAIKAGFRMKKNEG